MRSRHALIAIALSAGLACLGAPEAAAQAPGRGQTRQDPPRREQPRQSQPEARPRQDPPPRAEPARAEPAHAPEAERRPPARSTGEPELRRRKP